MEGTNCLQFEDHHHHHHHRLCYLAMHVEKISGARTLEHILAKMCIFVAR